MDTHKPKKRVGCKDGRRDEDLMKRLEDAIVAGNTYGVAATLAGITDRTLYLWKAQGEHAAPGSLAFQFLQRLKAAEAKAIYRNVMVIQKAAGKNWQAAAWWLERKFPDDWARKEKREITGANSGPVAVAAEVTMKEQIEFTPEAQESLLKRHVARKYGVVLGGSGGAGNGDPVSAAPAADPFP